MKYKKGQVFFHKDLQEWLVAIEDSSYFSAQCVRPDGRPYHASTCLLRPLQEDAPFLHWTKGGTGVSCLSSKAVLNHQESIELFGDCRIWVSGDALHTSLVDLGPYWIFHRNRMSNKTNPNNISPETTMNTATPASNLNIPAFYVLTSDEYESKSVLTKIVKDYLKSKGFQVPSGANVGNISSGGYGPAENGILMHGYTNYSPAERLQRYKCEVRRFDARTQFGKFIQFIEEETAKPKKPASIEVKLNKDYTATVSKDSVKVGCQTFNKQAIKDVLAALDSLES